MGVEMTNSTSELGVDLEKLGVSAHSQKPLSATSNSESSSVTISQADSDAESLPDISCEISPPPDGGLIAWLQVLGAYFAIFNAWGLVSGFGAFQEYYANDYLSDHPPGQIAWIGALVCCLAFFGVIVFAPLVDMGYLKQLALVGGIVESFGLMMLSLSREYYQIMLSQGVLTGLGCAMNFLVAVAMVSPYFRRKRSIASGLAALGSSTGGVIYPIAVRRLINDIGFPWAVRILGFICITLSFITFCVSKPRLPPRKVEFSLRSVRTSVGALIDLDCFTDIPLLVFGFGQLFGFFGYFMITFYAQSIVADIAPGSSIIIYVTSLMNSGSALGRTLPNFFADKLGPMNMLAPSALLSAVIVFAWTGVHDLHGTLALIVIFGFCSAPFVSLSSPVVSNMTPDLRRLGVRLGFAYMFPSLSGLLGGPVAGFIVESHGYNTMKIVSGVFLLACCVMVLISKFIFKGTLLCLA